MISFLVSTLALSLLVPADPPSAATEGVIPLKFKSHRKWSFDLPNERFAPVGLGFTIPHERGDLFPAELHGTALKIDSNGDNRVDQTVEGRLVDGRRVAFTLLTGTGLDGRQIRYAVRLVDRGAGWEYSSAGSQVGQIGDTRIRLIDQNLNGRYDDFGVDAMILGSGDRASFLSQVIRVGEELLQLRIRPDGSELTATRFDGPIGEIDFSSQVTAKAKLLSVILRSTDGRYSFDASVGPLKLPAATYQLVTGRFGLGTNAVDVATGESGYFRVKGGERREVTWGGPAHAKFRYARQGNEVTLLPEEVHYYGTAGEEYLNFTPFGASPKFTITDAETGLEIGTAIFGGC